MYQTYCLLCFVLVSLLFSRPAEASNGSIALYSGSSCSDPNPIYVWGGEDGLCTQITNSFWSFKMVTLDPGCTVTVYARDNQYCGLGRKFDIFLDSCVGNDTSINQFSVDCPSRDVAAPSADSTTSSIPSSTSSSVANSTTSATTSIPATTNNSDGLSTAAKIGFGIGIPIAVVLGALLAWYIFRKRYAKNKLHQSSAAIVAQGEGSRPEMEAKSGPRYEVENRVKVHELGGEWDGQGTPTTPTLCPSGSDGTRREGETEPSRNTAV